jgi:addiction module HigA family antidote
MVLAMNLKAPRVRNPVSVGEMLTEEFLRPAGITQAEFARRIGCSPRTVRELCRGRRGISATMAWRLSEVFKNSPEFWMNLQQANDLWAAWIALKEERKAI